MCLSCVCFGRLNPNATAAAAQSDARYVVMELMEGGEVSNDMAHKDLVS
jgi:hypothetical protein